MNNPIRRQVSPVKDMRRFLRAVDIALDLAISTGQPQYVVRIPLDPARKRLIESDFAHVVRDLGGASQQYPGCEMVVRVTPRGEIIYPARWHPYMSRWGL